MTNYRDMAPTIQSTLETLPSMSHVVMLLPYLGRPAKEEPPAALLNASHHHRHQGPAHLVEWHQVEYSRCPCMALHQFYEPLPISWYDVDVPAGALVELPWVVTYFP